MISYPPLMTDRHKCHENWGAYYLHYIILILLVCKYHKINDNNYCYSYVHTLSELISVDWVRLFTQVILFPKFIQPHSTYYTYSMYITQASYMYIMCHYSYMYQQICEFNIQTIVNKIKILFTLSECKPCTIWYTLLYWKQRTYCEYISISVDSMIHK